MCEIKPCASFPHLTWNARETCNLVKPLTDDKINQNKGRHIEATLQKDIAEPPATTSLKGRSGQLPHSLSNCWRYQSHGMHAQSYKQGMGPAQERNCVTVNKAGRSGKSKGPSMLLDI